LPALLTVTFSTAHIGVTALLVTVVSVPVAAVVMRPARAAEVVAIAAIAGVATFGWRLAANVDALNTDGVTWVSANDVLAGFVTYLTLGMYAAIKPPRDAPKFEQLRVAIFVVAVAVNVAAI